MKIVLNSKSVYQGGIFNGIFTISDVDINKFDFITCNIKGTVYTPGFKMTVLDSVHKTIEFVANKAILNYVIPRDTPPSFENDKYSVKYVIELNFYEGLNKSTFNFPFNLGSSYIFKQPLSNKIRIENDMICTKDHIKTPFQNVVDKLRRLKIDGCAKPPTSLEDLVVFKSKSINLESLHPTSEKLTETGDIWFYFNGIPDVLLNRKYCLDLHVNNSNYATIFYHKYTKDVLSFKISFFETVKEIKFDLKRQIDNELDEFFFLLQSDVSKCIYRSFEILLPSNIGFTIDCGVFAIRFFLFIHIDQLSFEIPLIIINNLSNIKIEYE